MVKFNIGLTAVFTLLMTSACLNSQAKEYRVSTPEEYQAIAAALEAGDTVILANGVWQDFEILLEGEGQKDAPILLTAETKGNVILSGQSNLRLAGRHLIVSGLVFKNGYTPSSAVIEFRKNSREFAYHSRVTEIVIDNYNNPDKQESDYWVALYGQHNRFDHNHLEGKSNKGVTVAVRLNHPNSQQNHHRIDHNYFGYRPTFGSNGGETLRIGTSHYSLTDSFTLVENNVFEHTNGEVEIISVKSGKNTLSGNVFIEAQGTLTMRHGNGNVIENNVFLGNGVKHTGGIRIINEDQTIRNNYLSGLTGYRFGSGFTIMNGVPNSPINRYHQVKNAIVENNTFVDVEHIQLAAGSDAERSAVPIDSRVRNNVFYTSSEQNPFTLFDDVSGIRFEQNLSNFKAPDEIQYGLTQSSMSLVEAENGLLYPSSSNKGEGAPLSLTVIDKAETGVAWYPKKPATVVFDSGSTIDVPASADALLDAIHNAKSGDILRLSKGHYEVSKLIPIDKTLTIQAAKAADTMLTYERTALFEISDGGSLKLENLTISGRNSPDAHGNSVVRTRKWGMIQNYRFEVHNSQIIELDINHSFHFFQTGKGAFADNIVINNTHFSDVTGDILKLNTEIEDLGVYNAEYVTVEGSQFSNVQGAIVKLYRGGTDESTFGPHLTFSNNDIKTVGNGKRNKEGASLYLHGVQVTNIDDNTFYGASPIVIEHTVGEPQTTVQNNRFNAKAAPQIIELRIEGPHTATVRNNTIIYQESVKQ